MTDDWKQDRIGSAQAGTNPTVIAKLPMSYAVIGDTQYLPGYCVLLVDDPRVERLTDLPRAKRLEFLASMDLLGEAVETVCRDRDPAFRRMNYQILGNLDPYLHAHLFPRYGWEPADRINHPVSFYSQATLHSSENALGPRHDGLRAEIAEALRNLAD